VVPGATPGTQLGALVPQWWIITTFPTSSRRDEPFGVIFHTTQAYTTMNPSGLPRP